MTAPVFKMGDKVLRVFTPTKGVLVGTSFFLPFTVAHVTPTTVSGPTKYDHVVTARRADVVKVPGGKRDDQ